MKHSSRFNILVVLIVCILLFSACAKKTEENAVYNVNLLENAELTTGESEIPDGWYTDAWYTEEWRTSYSSSVEDGVSILTIQSEASNDARFCQSVAVEGGAYYKISGEIRASAQEGAGANLSVGGTFVMTEPIMETDGEWVPVYVYIQAGTKQDEITLFVRLGGYGAESFGTASFRNLSLERVTAESIPEADAVYSAETASSEESSSESSESDSFSVTLTVVSTILYALFLLYAGSRIAHSPVERVVKKGRSDRVMFAMLAVALLLRIVLALSVSGYPNDIACWQAWSGIMAENGPWGFYSAASFADYPPGYMLVLWIVGGLAKLFGCSAGSSGYILLVKLPSVAADLVIGWGLYKAADKEKFPREAALLAAALWLFHPAVLCDSSAWGQVDAFLTLPVLGYLWFLYKKKIPYASLLLVIGTLMKPQMLLFAPVLPVVWIRRIKEDGIRPALFDVVQSVLLGIAAVLVIALPFTAGQNWDWLIKLYTGTMGSYPYGSVNAANFISLIGGLWKADTECFLGISYKVWGWSGIILSCGAFFWKALKDRDPKNIFVHTSVLITCIFTFGCSMHERYMFSVIALLMVGYVVTRRRSLLWLSLSTALVQTLNIGVVLAEQYLPTSGTALVLLSLLSTFNGLFFAVEGWRIAYGCADLPFPVFTVGASEEKKPLLTDDIPVPSDAWEPHGVRMVRKDWIICLAITAVYAVVALVNLGSLSFPQTEWKAETIGETVILDLGEDHALSDTLIMARGLSSDGAVLAVETSDDGEYWSYAGSVVLSSEGDDSAGDVFKWIEHPMEITERYVRFTMETPSMRILEMALLDENDEPLPILEVFTEDGISEENGSQNAFDEQDTVPSGQTYWNSTYFDEIYHARTAWEHLNGVTSVYEWTHPPLGKLLISLGILLFGMCPFGWRFVGTVFGIMMLPALYGMAKALFRETKWAALSCLMMALDFMHFTQTRIATIDVYATFFVITMYTCMLRYLLLDHKKAPIRVQFLWLGLSGLSFGLGAACKWTCLYAGVGLAVLFFGKCGIRIMAMRKSVANSGKAERTKVEKDLFTDLLMTCVYCVLVFILVPAAIYCASYMPMMPDGKFDINVVIRYAKQMYSYHSNLVDDHFFKSPWYQWPIVYKPMWYYKDSTLADGWMGSIAAMGNPLIWWTGTAAILCLLARSFKKRSFTRTDTFMILGYASQYLPWVLVPRSTFIYHYFTSTPFFIMAIVPLMKTCSKRKWGRIALITFFAVAALLFVMFYPVMSGVPIPSWYGKLLKWFPSWYFTY